MLDASRTRIERDLPPDATLLDVGGWGKPFPRADWVVDLMPWETRGLYGSEPGGDERFTEDTWVVRDFCDRAPFPFEDDQFDFVVCSHVLEDIRDPIRVCAELSRIAKAGYIEVPSRIEEQTRGVNGPWVGWSHHRWLVDADIDAASLSFVHKPGVLQGGEGMCFPRWAWEVLDPVERVTTLWWQGSFTATERIFIDDDLDAYLRDLVDANLPTLEQRRTLEAPADTGSGGGRTGLRRPRFARRRT